jgi:elongator complex protein 3
MHEWLYKQWRNTDTIRSIYSRLYEHTTYYPTIEDFLPSIVNQVIPDSHSITSIIGWTIDAESDRAFVSLDTRSREIRHRRKHEPEDIRIVIRAYRSSVGREYFIAMETSQWYLYWFTRLLLPDVGNSIEYSGLGEHTALIRELHVYGQVAKINTTDENISTTQHTGVGRTVMAIAEQISKQAWYHRLSVIAGVGVKEYYRNQLWYHDDDTYVVKELS